MHPAEVTLLDYVVGELPSPESGEIRQHVATCAVCRDRIVALSMAMDELDRLPSAGHARLPASGLPMVRGRIGRRFIPIAILVAAGIGVLALFQLGGPQVAAPPVTGERIVLETASAQPEQMISELLGGLPHSVTVDRDDPRHLIVLVQQDDVGAARGRLIGTSSPDGKAYVVDIAGTASAP